MESQIVLSGFKSGWLSTLSHFSNVAFRPRRLVVQALWPDFFSWTCVRVTWKSLPPFLCEMTLKHVLT